MMQCPNCNATINEEATYCGNCGKLTKPMQAMGVTTGSSMKPIDDLPIVISSYESRDRQESVEGGPLWENLPSVPASDRPKQASTPLTPLRPQPRRISFGRVALFAALILLLIAGATGGAIIFLKQTTPPVGRNNTPHTPPVAASANGHVVFLDAQNSTGHTDALKISINGLQTPPSGSQYNAWFVNEQNEQIVPLGTLLEKDGAFTLNFSGNEHHTNLLGAGNKIEITLEQGDVKLPTRKVILAGAFPPRAFVHIQHLLFSFSTTPGHIGILVGLQDQTQLLDSQALVLRNMVGSSNVIAIQCMAQSLLDIIEGTHGPHFQQLPTQCVFQNITTTGDGFGLLGQNGYVAGVAEHASLAATQSDATDTIRKHAGDVEIATNNIQGWIMTVEQDALNLLTNPMNTTKVQEIVTLCDQAHHGVDIDGDALVDPVPGEAGAITAYLHGQLMASLTLVAEGGITASFGYPIYKGSSPRQAPGRSVALDQKSDRAPG